MSREFRKVELEPTLKIHNPSVLAKEGFQGVLVEGTFQDYKEEEVKAKNGKTFMSRYYIFEDDNGLTHYINAFGKLDKLMKKASPGDYCRVSYLGKDNDYHQCELEIA